MYNVDDWCIPTKLIPTVTYMIPKHCKFFPGWDK